MEHHFYSYGPLQFLISGLGAFLINNFSIFSEIFFKFLDIHVHCYLRYMVLDCQWAKSVNIRQLLGC